MSKKKPHFLLSWLLLHLYYTYHRWCFYRSKFLWHNYLSGKNSENIQHIFVIANFIWFFFIFKSILFRLIACFHWNRHPFRMELAHWPRIKLCNPWSKSQVTEKGSIFYMEATNTQWRACRYQDVKYRYVNCFLHIKHHNYQTLIKLSRTKFECSIYKQLDTTC